MKIVVITFEPFWEIWRQFFHYGNFSAIFRIWHIFVKNFDNVFPFLDWPSRKHSSLSLRNKAQNCFIYFITLVSELLLKLFNLISLRIILRHQIVIFFRKLFDYLKQIVHLFIRFVNFICLFQKRQGFVCSLEVCEGSRLSVHCLNVGIV